MDKPITEDDLRLPQFRGANVDEFERRCSDGAIVRKDRWERGIRAIASALEMDGRDGFEIDDLVARVRDLVERQPSATGAPRMAAASVETPNYSFTIYAGTSSEAESLLRRAWPVHCAQTGANPDLVEALVGDINCEIVSRGQVLRDREVIFDDNEGQGR